MSELGKSEDSNQARYHPFTRESLEAIEDRIHAKELAKKQLQYQKEHPNENEDIQTEHKVDEDSDDEHPDFGLENGMPLPIYMKYLSPIPTELYDTPIEDIDNFYQNEKTFVIVSKRHNIYRFSATKSLWLMDPFHPLRRLALFISVHLIFSAVVVITILINCIVMSQKNRSIAENLEPIFIAVYTIELVVKVIARGFILDKFTYLRDPWNWLHLLIVISAYISIFQVNLGSIAVLRTVRALRVLRTIAIVRGLRTIVSTIIVSAKNLQNVFSLTLFLLSVFALIGLDTYMGRLTQKCIKTLTEAVLWNMTEQEVVAFRNNASNWYFREDKAEPLVCGNFSRATICPDGYTCYEKYGGNPNYGYSNFDSFGWALLSAFQLLTEDFWEDLYRLICRAMGPWHVIFFISIIFIGSFYLLNLILATVATSYDELQKKAETEEAEEYEIIHTILGDHQTADETRLLMGSPSITSINSCTWKCDFAGPIGLEKSGLDKEKEAYESMEKINLQSEGGDKTLDNLDCPNMIERKVSSTDTDIPFIDRTPVSPVIEKKDILALNDIIQQAARLPRHQSRKDEVKVDPPCKEKVLAQWSKWTDVFCYWNCCGCWVKFQMFLCLVAYDPFFELFITLCVVVNVGFMAADSSDKSPEMEQILEWANCVFTIIFAIEAGLKILAINPKYYFKELWNIFDFAIVVLSVLDLILEGEQLAVVRIFRVLRIFKLAKSWPTLDLLVTIMANTVGALTHLTLTVGIIIFMFAVMGMELFAKNYVERKDLFHDGNVPRWNFVDFFHSFMIVFRILCGEWIESLWDCLQVNGYLCLPFYLVVVVIGNIVVFNIFIALLLNSFEGANLTYVAQDEEVTVAIQRFKRFFAWLKGLFSRAVKTPSEVKTQIDSQEAAEGLGKKTSIEDHLAKQENIGHLAWTVTVDEAIDSNNDDANDDVMKGTENEKDTDEKAMNNSNCEKTSRYSETPSELVEEEKKDLEKGEEVIDEQVGEEKAVGGKEESELEEGEELAKCCSDCCYENIRWCAGKDTPFWDGWHKLRRKCNTLINHTYFETVILFCIIIHSILLTMEDKYIKEKKLLEVILIYLDHAFTLIFLIEMVIKLLAIGFRRYFTSKWCWLDFVINLVSTVYLVAYLVGTGNANFFQSIRTLRALRPLKILPRLQGMRVVVVSLVLSIPSIFNVLLVCLAIWLMFSIAGVQLLGGKFYKCKSQDGQPFDLSDAWQKHLGSNNSDIHVGRTECINLNMTWENSKINFDNVANGYLALFQVATFEGWMEIMADATDSTEQHVQPKYEANIYIYLYFITFIIVGSFFVLNLFTGVVIDTYKMEKKKSGGSLEMFMTYEQMLYYRAMKRMGSRKPVKAIPRPRFQSQATVFDLVKSKTFNKIILLFILLNMVVLATHHYDITETFQDALNALDIAFIVIFSTEILLKLFAFRFDYFTISWGVFDFVVIILSILDVVLDNVIKKYFISPPLLRVIKIGRLLRTVKCARGIRVLLTALVASLPALINLSLILFIVMFIYAIFGMSFFKNVKNDDGLDDTFNFETFGRSMVLLFQLATSAGWNDILEPLMNEENCTLPNPDLDEEGDCGSSAKAIVFLVSYLIITFLIIVNMYIAVIIDSYSNAVEEVQEALTGEDVDMYYDAWKKYDPNATGYINFVDSCDFIAELDFPFQINKPNKYNIVLMAIPILKGDQLFCVDVIHALTKLFFARKGHILDESEDDDLGDVIMVDRPGYEVISNTLRRQREEYSARVIQRAWRRHRNLAKFEEISSMAATEDSEPQQTSIVILSDGQFEVVGDWDDSRSSSTTSRPAEV